MNNRVPAGESVLKTYLTIEEKLVELGNWERNKNADPGVRPLLKILNAIDGVCTVQSCTGHYRSISDQERHVVNGHIEMRLDEKRTKLFYQGMQRLHGVKSIENVLIHWRAGEQRCLVIFAPDSMSHVIAVLYDVLSR